MALNVKDSGLRIEKKKGRQRGRKSYNASYAAGVCPKMKCSNRTVHTLRKLYPEIVSGGEHSHKYDRSTVERVAQIRSERYLR